MFGTSFWERHWERQLLSWHGLKSGSHREHREHGENRHRGVSASSFRDGAIPRFSFVPKFKKQGSHRKHRENGENRHRGVSAFSFCDGAIPILERHRADRGVVKNTYPAITPRASRRKRPFFSRRRDTPVFVRSKYQKTGFAQRTQRARREQASRRKRFFFLRRRDTYFRET